MIKNDITGKDYKSIRFFYRDRKEEFVNTFYPDITVIQFISADARDASHSTDAADVHETRSNAATAIFWHAISATGAASD